MGHLLTEIQVEDKIIVCRESHTEGEIFIKRLLLLFITIILLSACNQDTESSEQKELREKLLDVFQAAGNKEIHETDINKAVIEAAALELQGEERDWFVRSYLLYTSAGKKIKDTKAVYEHSQLNMQHEQTWQALAQEKYGVTLDEERLQEIIDMNVNSFSEEESSLPEYLADTLGYSMSEFFSIYDRHI